MQSNSVQKEYIGFWKKSSLYCTMYNTLYTTQKAQQLVERSMHFYRTTAREFLREFDRATPIWLNWPTLTCPSDAISIWVHPPVQRHSPVWPAAVGIGFRSPYPFHTHWKMHASKTNYGLDCICRNSSRGYNIYCVLNAFSLNLTSVQKSP